MKTNQIYKLLIILISAFGLISTTLAETVTLDEFLDDLKQHPIFEKENLTAQILKQNKEGLLGEEDWQFHSSLFYSHEEPVFAGFGPERSDAFELSAGIDRLFWNNGGILSANYQTSRADLKVKSLVGLPSTYYQNNLIVSYQLPLLKNKGGFLNRLSYDLREFDIDISDIVAKETQEEFLTSFSLKFLEWVYLEEQKKIITERLNISKELYENTKEKRDANLVDEVEVVRAENSVIIATQNLLFIESQFESLREEFAKTVDDDRYLQSNPQFDLYHQGHESESQEVIDSVVSNSRIINNITLRVNQLELVKRGFLEQERASLDLVTQLGLKNGEDDFGSAFVMDKPDFTVGLRYSIPIGNRKAKSDIVQSDLEIEQLQKNIDELKRTLNSSLSSVSARISGVEKVIEQNIKQIESSELKTSEEMKLYRQGRGELTFVIQSRDSEQAAKLQYAANMLLYQQLNINYRSLLDRLYQ